MGMTRRSSPGADAHDPGCFVAMQAFWGMATLSRSPPPRDGTTPWTTSSADRADEVRKSDSAGCSHNASQRRLDVSVPRSALNVDDVMKLMTEGAGN
jgi:hypothetical protein